MTGWGWVQAKQLAEARRCFANAVELGVANNYTYTNMLNAFVRCGDVSGAARCARHCCCRRRRRRCSCSSSSSSAACQHGEG